MYCISSQTQFLAQAGSGNVYEMTFNQLKHLMTFGVAEQSDRLENELEGQACCREEYADRILVSCIFLHVNLGFDLKLIGVTNVTVLKKIVCPFLNIL